MNPVKKAKHTEIKKIINHFLHRPNITHSLKKKILAQAGGWGGEYLI